MIYICSGMYRSGSTLQYQIVGELVERYMDFGVVAGWVHHMNYPQFERGDNGGPVVIKSHILTDQMIDAVDDGRSAIVYIYRDIRDVAASLMQTKNKTFQQIVESGVLDVCVKNFYVSTSLTDSYIARYESVVVNLRAEIASVAKWLGINVPVKSLEAIADKLSIESQKKVIETYKASNEFIQQQKQKFHPKTLLHHNHINDGAIGKYKWVLSYEEIELLNKKYDGWLVENGYEL